MLCVAGGVRGDRARHSIASGGLAGPGACILAAREAGDMIIDAFSDYGGKLVLPKR